MNVRDCKPLSVYSEHVHARRRGLIIVHPSSVSSGQNVAFFIIHVVLGLPL